MHSIACIALGVSPFVDTPRSQQKRLLMDAVLLGGPDES